MRFQDVSIFGVAHLDAPHRVPSEEVEKRLAPTLERLGMRSDLIRDLSGIMERRLWDEGFQPSDAAAEAGVVCRGQGGWDRFGLRRKRASYTGINRLRQIAKTGVKDGQYCDRLPEGEGDAAIGPL